MPSLKDIRQRITSIKSTQQTTKAMKMVSASKLRRAQDHALKLRGYASKLNEVLTNLTASLDPTTIESPYLESREATNYLLVVITSNRGLCGAFNTNVIKLVSERLQEPDCVRALQEGRLKLLCIGKKGYDFFSKRGIPIVGNQNFDIFQGLSFDKLSPVNDLIMEGFVKRDFDSVEVFYNEFVNVATQRRTQSRHLPISVQHAVVGVKTGGKKESTPGVPKPPADYIYEPNRDELIKELLPTILRTKLYSHVLESHASEHAARMIAMDAANENAEAILKDLRLQYNKARQAAITKEILEIVGGAEALASS
jgi:F-type H+-transporting ATPase subunit gamma